MHYKYRYTISIYSELTVIDKMQSNDPGGPGSATATSTATATGIPDPVKQENIWKASKSWMIRWRGSRQLVLVIVAIALLLDNMLLTVVGEYLTHFFFFSFNINGVCIPNIYEHNPVEFRRRHLFVDLQFE